MKKPSGYWLMPAGPFSDNKDDQTSFITAAKALKLE
jgi:hypothetical protein